MAVSLSNLYTGMLGRDPTAQDTSYWNGVFGNDIDYAEGRQFLDAAQPELQQRANSANSLSNLYTGVLGRAGDPSGVDAWRSQVNNNTIDDTMRTNFLNSANTELTGRLSNMFSPPSAATNPEVQTPNTHGTEQLVSPGTVNFGSLNTINRPVAPTLQSVTAPQYNNQWNDRYANTFSNPQTYWDEYSQGKGASINEAAARGMAKSGHTGLMPTLQTNSYQDYMSNYLPSVRKDMAAGLSYEQAQNNNLEAMYGQQLDYNKGIFGSEVSSYGNQLGYEKDKMAAMTAAGNQATQLRISQLETLAKNYGVDSQFMSQVYSSMAQMFPHMDDASREAFLTELAGAIGIQNYGSKVNNLAGNTNGNNTNNNTNVNNTTGNTYNGGAG